MHKFGIVHRKEGIFIAVDVYLLMQSLKIYLCSARSSGTILRSITIESKYVFQNTYWKFLTGIEEISYSLN